MMTRKETVEQALNHKEGKVPVDFGGTTNTGIRDRLVRKLRDYYGLEQRPVKVIEPYQMLGSIDDDLKDVLGSDTTPLWTPTTMFGFDNINWKEWRSPWGQDLLCRRQYDGGYQWGSPDLS